MGSAVMSSLERRIHTEKTVIECREQIHKTGASDTALWLNKQIRRAKYSQSPVGLAGKIRTRNCIKILKDKKGRVG